MNYKQGALTSVLRPRMVGQASRRASAACLAMLFLLNCEGLAQQMIWYVDSNDPSDVLFGGWVGPDTDSDGIADLLLANPAADCLMADEGEVYHYSTTSGQLHSWCGDGSWGDCALWVDDIDGGGVADFVVTQTGWVDPVAFGPGTGRIQLLSFETGNVLREWTGTQTYGYFGQYVDVLGDIDGDGYRELIVGQPNYGGATEGKVWILSLANGSTIRVHDGIGAFRRLGMHVLAAGDVDGDGVEDYAISSTPNSGSSSRVDVRSGLNGTLIGKIVQFVGGDNYGGALSRYVDVDGDGLPEILIGGLNGPASFVIAYSPMSEQIVFKIDGAPNMDRFGYYANLDMPDLNGDGFAEMLIAAIFDSTRGSTDGRVDLISGRSHRPLYVFYPPIGPTNNYGAPLRSADFNLDGIEDIIITSGSGGSSRAKGGHTAIFAGNDLWLQAEPPEPDMGDTVVVDLRGAEPGRLGLIALTDIDGAPLFETLLVAPFDANGELQLSADVDPSWSGMQFTIMAWAENRKGRGPLMDASPFVVSVQ